MRSLFSGPGRWGAYGGLMADSHAVSLVCREDHAREINADGLWIDGLVEKKAFPKASVSVAGLPVQDLVILTVKAYDTRAAMRSIAPLMGNGPSLLVIQNGLTVLKDVQEMTPGASVGVASFGADYIGPGHVRLTGMGDMVIGNPDDPDDINLQTLETLNSTGIPCRRSNDMKKEVWRKAVTSSCINPITAITRKRNSIIVDDTGINNLARICFGESFSAGAATGHSSLMTWRSQTWRMAARATAGNRSSMLQDVGRGRRDGVSTSMGRSSVSGPRRDRCPPEPILVSLVSALSAKHDPRMNIKT